MPGDTVRSVGPPFLCGERRAGGSIWEIAILEIAGRFFKSARFYPELARASAVAAREGAGCARGPARESRCVNVHSWTGRCVEWLAAQVILGGRSVADRLRDAAKEETCARRPAGDMARAWQAGRQEKPGSVLPVRRLLENMDSIKILQKYSDKMLSLSSKYTAGRLAARRKAPLSGGNRNNANGSSGLSYR